MLLSASLVGQLALADDLDLARVDAALGDRLADRRRLRRRPAPRCRSPSGFRSLARCRKAEKSGLATG